MTSIESMNSTDGADAIAPRNNSRILSSDSPEVPPTSSGPVAYSKIQISDYCCES